MSKWTKFARILVDDPKLILNRIRCQLTNIPDQKVVLKKVNNKVGFEFDFSLDPIVKAMYFDAYEIPTLNIFRRILKQGDTFIDIGANIGYISAYAASLVGIQGRVHSFEPVPGYYKRLERLAQLNPNYRIYVNNVAMSDREGTSSIMVSNVANIGWNTMVSGFMSKETVKETIEIKTQRIDDYLQKKNVRKVSLIKIDTEGFEVPVLRGLHGFLQDAAEKPYLLVELAPQAYPLLQVSIQDVEDFVRTYAYSVRLVERPGKEVPLSGILGTTNLLFVPQ